MENILLQKELKVCRVRGNDAGTLLPQEAPRLRPAEGWLSVPGRRFQITARTGRPSLIGSGRPMGVVSSYS